MPDTRESDDKSGLMYRIEGLRESSTAEGPPDLLSCIDAAALLADTVAQGNPSNWQPEILEIISGLVRLVEDGNPTGLSDLALGEVLVQIGAVTQDQVDRALSDPREIGRQIGDSLVRMGAATEGQIEQALRIQDSLRQESAVPGDLFSSIVPNHPLWDHPFLQRCREKKLSSQDVQVLAVQMYKFCTEFSRLLSAVFVRCPDEQARVVIADNLYDETGQGDPSRTHPELFRRFTRALGITDEELENKRVLPETQSLIDTYMALPERHGYLAGLGAICYASENIVATLYTQLLAGINNGVDVDKSALAFFEQHVELDQEHAGALIRLVNDGVRTKSEAKRVVLAVKEALAARIRFFDGVERACQTIRDAEARAVDSNA